MNKIISVVVVLILILVGVGVYLMLSKKEMSSKTEETIWRTYIFHGYSFRYPADWNVSEENMLVKGMLTDEVSAVRISSLVFPSTEDTVLIGSYIVPGGEYISDCLPASSLKNSDPSFSNFKCDDSSGITVTTTTQNTVVVGIFNEVVRSIKKEI